MEKTAIYKSTTAIIKIKEDSIFVSERKERISWWGNEIFDFNKQFSFKDIEEVEFKQDALPTPIKETAFVQSLTIRFKNEKNKVVIASAEHQVGNSLFRMTKWVKNETYDDFVNVFVAQLHFYPHIKVYAYTGMNGKVLQKMSKFMPSFTIGSLVVGTPFWIKILLNMLKIGTGMITLWGFEYIWVALMVGVFGTTFFVNKKKKQQSLLSSVSELPVYFLPSPQTEVK
ncbi:hypothetical protein [Thermoflexibacter ruber]|uniref:Uncharacterized protein n=1 Tax=Thermoflexibacter ruber TaxID=1003 RepID=A0A1I2DZB5_9BACT|nr:hypothetical protein [Thermoflexibacter ruber]SFE86052.1 hypothetical protein SAMN04488541_100896 [Thermoflexibacter ruber]